jgi:hypothetical protein
MEARAMSFRHILAAGAVATLIASTPLITEISPATPANSTEAQSIAVTGKDFLPGLSLEVQTPDSRTLLINGGAIAVRGPESFTASVVLERPGAYLFKVINTDGGMSRPFSFQVRDRAPAAPAITIDRVVPDAPMKSDQAQTIRLEGRNLDSGVAVTVMDPAGSDVPNVAVTKATSTSIDVNVLLNQRGEYILQANNRAGATSNRVTIRVQ